MTSWKKTFASSFIAQILSILGFSFALPFLPFFIGQLGDYNAGEQAYWAGITLAASGLTLAVFAPIWGILADRYGRKLMVVRAMFGGTAVLFLISFVQTVPQLIICRLFQGMFTGTVAASVALVASVVPQHRSGFTLGMMQTAVFMGTTIGPFFGGLAADAYGYRISFRIGALLCLLGGMLVYFFAHEKFDKEEIKNNLNPGFRKIFMIKGFIIAVLVMFGVRFSNTMINPSFPLIIKDIMPSLDNLNSVTGSVMASAALAGAFSAAMLGLAGDRAGHRRILIGCSILAGCASAGHYLAFSISGLVLARIAFGLAAAGMLPAANASIHSIIDRRSLGKAYGLATSLSMMGAALGPFMGGFIAKNAGLRAPFLFTAGGQIMLAVIVILFFKTKHYR
jgi:MFS transporter, DHA1 family, multidrug resistance protein